MEWNSDMALAPRDGTYVLGFGKFRDSGFGPGATLMKFFNAPDGWWAANALPFEPTHWCEIPPPPKTTDR